MSNTTSVNQRANRSLNRALRDSELLYEALQSMLVEVLTAEHGASVTASNIKETFPGLRPRFDGSVSTADFAYCANNDVQQIADDLVGFPDDVPKRFWQELGRTMHRNVVVIHDTRSWDYCGQHLLTDGKHDWFFHMWDTNYAGGEYEIGQPTKATRASRKDAVLEFACDAGSWISGPEKLTTSLTKDDLRWLREAQELPVQFRRGMLSQL